MKVVMLYLTPMIAGISNKRCQWLTFRVWWHALALVTREISWHRAYVTYLSCCYGKNWCNSRQNPRSHVIIERNGSILVWYTYETYMNIKASNTCGKYHQMPIPNYRKHQVGSRTDPIVMGHTTLVNSKYFHIKGLSVHWYYGNMF